MIVKTLDELREIADGLREDEKRIVTCNGAFDLLHPGHVHFLEEAKKQGDILIVGLNSDSSIKRYKSDERPIEDQDKRSEKVDALGTVDYVVVFEEEHPFEFLKAVKPHVHCNGEEYGKDCIEAPLLKELGARLHLIPRFGDHSTTRLVQKRKDHDK